MSSERQQRQHQDTVAEIKSIARQQMAVKGAAALSMGAIARAMGVSTPALYRYFANRDALVTAITVDAHRELSQRTRAAVTEAGEQSLGERFLTITRTYRRWALGHPQDYVLCHGAIFPGYQLPMELAVAAAEGSLSLFLDVLVDAARQGVLAVPGPYRNPPVSLREALAPIQAFVLAHVPTPSSDDGGGDSPLPDSAVLVTLAYTSWLHVHSLVWQEIGGLMPEATFSEGGLYELEMQVLAERLGLLEPQEPQ